MVMDKISPRGLEVRAVKFSDSQPVLLCAETSVLALQHGAWLVHEGALYPSIHETRLRGWQPSSSGYLFLT